MNVDTKTLKKLIKLIEDSNLTSLEVEQNGEVFRLGRNLNVVAPQAAPVSPSASTFSTETAPGAEPPQAAAVPTGYQIKSPMVGSFYRSSSPEARPFVEIGQRVKAGDTLCIIEAMKMMNHIETDKTGTIIEIIPEDASPVQYDQVLFVIDTEG